MDFGSLWLPPQDILYLIMIGGGQTLQIKEDKAHKVKNK